jgi:hypothetical protein
MPLTVKQFLNRRKSWEKWAQKEAEKQEKQSDGYFEMLGNEIERHPIGTHKIIRGA